jgi:hypothetical protein
MFAGKPLRKKEQYLTKNIGLPRLVVGRYPKEERRRMAVA